MLRRKIEETFIKWRNTEDRLPLIVEGARQVGKTTSILNFAAKNYETVYSINFFEHPHLSRIFNDSLDSNTILTRLSLEFPNLNLKEGSTLIFLDEIQHCPNARTALKFLAKDKRFDVIATGSLLGLYFSEIESIPVGYTETIQMHPLDFEEFLWALGISENIIDGLRNCYMNILPVDSFIHEAMLNYFSTYMVIGGMPKAVDSFAKNRNFALVDKIQQGIIEDYRKDVIKYAEDKEKGKILRTMESIPTQLAKDYKKFQYSVVEKGARASKYALSLDWLRDASIVSFCRNLSRLEPPLEAYAINNEFKVYMDDNGLLVSMYGGDTANRIINGESGVYKGAIFENIVAGCLKRLGHELYYFSPSQSLEIDFVIMHKGKPCLVEVKSGDNNKSKSLKTVLTTPKYGIDQAIRLSRRNVGEEGGILSLPLYMVMFIEKDASPLLSGNFLASDNELLKHLKTTKKEL